MKSQNTYASKFCHKIKLMPSQIEMFIEFPFQFVISFYKQ